MKSYREFIEEIEIEDNEIFVFSAEDWSALSAEEKEDYLDIEEEIEGYFNADNGLSYWVIGGDYYYYDHDEDGMEESKIFKGRSRIQVRKTAILKRRNRFKDRAKKLKLNIKRRRSDVKIKRKRMNVKRIRRFGGGDKSGRSGKIGAARKMRGGRTISV